MSTADRYVIPVEMRTWDVAASGAARFSWEYDGGRERLLSLYQKGKDKQWDAMHRIDWHLDVDLDDPLGQLGRGELGVVVTQRDPSERDVSGLVLHHVGEDLLR